MAPYRIQFDHQRHVDRGVFDVVPRLDGTPLTELIDRFETRAGMRPAGEVYGGLNVRRVHERFHGATDPKAAVLGCSCGDEGCWPLLARITVTGDLVVWDDFEQPHRPERDYTGFGPFRFDRGQYDEAVRELSPDEEA
ncbi:hypothetical protein [Amycolatopsis suaedae]|uniref:Uncharacterized protein n=1 Tax=Amycolatopsis suaedae TaxID=2510978 RepID=A0A4Q7JBV7_9PSEU|nr:hypothetical protein [Amycolatopsis suaedae]RZQ63764.1 hypothetical protein EWH70_11385 [Amycolatopsis suaedae]